MRVWGLADGEESGSVAPGGGVCVCVCVGEWLCGLVHKRISRVRLYLVLELWTGSGWCVLRW